MSTLPTKHATLESGARATAYSDRLDGIDGWTVQAWSADGNHGYSTFAHTDPSWFRGRHWQNGNGDEFPTLKAVMEHAAGKAQEIETLSRAMATLGPKGRIVQPGPGHIDLGNGGYAADVHLDLDTRDMRPESGTVAELHLGLAKHDPEVGPEVEDVAAVGIELTLGDIDALITALQALKASLPTA